MNIKASEFVAEIVGTFFLVFIGAGAILANAGLVGVALAHGLALAIGISALGHISGGVFNPAVAIGLAVARKLEWGKAFAYIIAELIGGAISGYLLLAIYPQQAIQAASLGTPLVANGVSALQATLLEAVLTFLLMTAVMGTAVDSKGPRDLAGFGIGLVLVFDILAGGGLTGASMNPARTFGPALAGGYWAMHWVYWVGPVLGAVAASLLYAYVLSPAVGGKGEKKGAA
jgi:MIP family channel proteins